MAWSTPRTWATNDIVTATMMNANVRDNTTFLRAFHGGRMWQSAALSQTATSAWQLVTWDTTDYDTDSFNVLASEWFVVPTGFDGTYRATATVPFAGNATGFRFCRIVKNETYAVRVPNGVGTLVSTGTGGAGVGAGAGTTEMAEWTGPLVAGDHLTLEAWQSSGGSLAFSVGKDALWFELHYLGS